MTEIGDFIEDVFTDYTEYTTVRIKPPGTAAVVRAVRKRRRKRALLLVLMTVFVVAVPVTTFLVTAYG